MSVDEDYVSEDINRDGRISGDTMLAVMQDHEKSLLGLARIVDHGTRYQPVYEKYVNLSNGDLLLYKIDDNRNLIALTSSLTGHTMHSHGRCLHRMENVYYNGRRFFDPTIGQFISRDSLGAWADSHSLGNAYTFAGNNAAMGTDPDGEIFVAAAFLLIPIIATYAIAELTESDTAASFSPVHNLVTAYTGYSYFEGEKLGGLERGLGVFDFVASLIPGGAFASKGVRGLRFGAKAADELLATAKAAKIAGTAGKGAKASRQASPVMKSFLNDMAKARHPEKLIARAQRKIAEVRQAVGPGTGLVTKRSDVIYASRNYPLHFSTEGWDVVRPAQGGR